MRKITVLSIALLALGLIISNPCLSYDSKGKRDPFIPLIGSKAVWETQGVVQVKSVEDVKLEGIVYDVGGHSTAIINGMILEEGDKVSGMTLKKIEPKKVILVIGEEKHEVFLVDKTGGELSER